VLPGLHDFSSTKECWWLQRHPPSVVPSNVQLASNLTFFDDLGSFGFTF
jgi:hypothetical protein